MIDARKSFSANRGQIEPHAGLLTLPPAGQLLYKMMKAEHLISSISGAYLHFNRVDSYKDFVGCDLNDGEQVPLDRPGNEKTVFEKDVTFTAAKYYDQCRRRTYACCFSLENSDFIWKNYANGSVHGKVCIVFDFTMLRQRLNSTLPAARLLYGGVHCVQILDVNYGLINYVDRVAHVANDSVLPNPICYTYLKDKSKFSEEKDLRIALSAPGIGRFALSDGSEMEFPENLQMAFDYRAALADGTITQLILETGASGQFLEDELLTLGIGRLCGVGE